MNRIVYVLLAVNLLVAVLLLGCTEPEDVSVINECNKEKGLLKNQLIEKQSLIDSQNLKIIELQENEVYLRKAKEDSEQKFNELEDVYSALWGDASSCYWANYCLYFEEGCVETFKDEFIDYSAEELHIAYSDLCDGMYRDWDEYQSYDKELN